MLPCSWAEGDPGSGDECGGEERAADEELRRPPAPSSRWPDMASGRVLGGGVWGSGSSGSESLED